MEKRKKVTILTLQAMKKRGEKSVKLVKISQVAEYVK